MREEPRTYTYDARGNRLTAVITGAAPFSQTLTDNAANQITSTYTYAGTSQNHVLSEAFSGCAYKVTYGRADKNVKFGLRWYNPTTGAWTQQDTLDAPLDPANANLYAFAGGEPINGNDPSRFAIPARRDSFCRLPTRLR